MSLHECRRGVFEGSLKYALGMLAVVGISLISSGCPGERQGRYEALPDRSGEQRTIYIQATEMDARRSTGQDPFPQETIDAWPDYFGPGDDPFDRAGKGGYYLFMTAEDEWRIGSYMFVPRKPSPIAANISRWKSSV